MYEAVRSAYSDSEEHEGETQCLKSHKCHLVSQEVLLYEYHLHTDSTICCQNFPYTDLETIAIAKILWAVSMCQTPC